MDFFTHQLTCRYDLLPPEAMAHHFLGLSSSFDSYTTCLGSNIQKDEVLAECVRYIAPICGNTVETSLTATCNPILKYTKELFAEQSSAITDMKKECNITDVVHCKRFQGIVDQLQKRLLSSGESFDPRILYKLKWFILHHLCLDRVKENNQNCLHIAIKKCKQSHIQVLQINRMKMEEVEPLLMRNPDLFVIYYIRDPRATAVSRVNTKHMMRDITDNRPLNEAYYLCHKMAADLRQFNILQSKYPGSLQMIKYEDLVKQPYVTASRIYSRFGKKPSPRWSTFAQKTMHNSGAQGEYVLKDAVANLQRWRNEIPHDQLTEVNQYCGPLLDALDYEM